MAKIAVEVEQAVARRTVNGGPSSLTARLLARGEGWTVEDVVCTSGPRDRSFEECHTNVSIAVIAAGTFQYRSSAGRELMTPGSLLLGNPGQSFECEHDHGEGDRCISFRYEPGYFEDLAANASVSPEFRMLRLPPSRALAPLIARACAGVAGPVDAPWEELSIQLAAQAVQLAGAASLNPSGDPPSAVARVTRIVREIERHPDHELSLADLAIEAGLSRYHFLRTFERLTGLTPHQYILRARLREAAVRLAREPAKVLDIALDCGFGDVSNFNRAFVREFGVSPRAYRKECTG